MKPKASLGEPVIITILQMGNLGNREVNCLSKVTQTKPASTLEHMSLDFLPMMLSTTQHFPKVEL